jgi:hypothetical protein
MTEPHTGANSASEAPELEEKYEGLLRAGFVVPSKDFSINVVNRLTEDQLTENQLTENQQVFVSTISTKSARYRPISFYFRCVAMGCASALTAIEVFTFLFSFWAANTAL